MDSQNQPQPSQSNSPQHIPGSIDDIKAKHAKHSKVLKTLTIVCIIIFVVVLVVALVVIFRNPSNFLKLSTGNINTSTNESNNQNGSNSSNEQQTSGSNSNQVSQYTPEPISSSTANAIAPNLQNEILAAIAAEQKKDPTTAKLVTVTPTESPGITVVEDWVVSFGNQKSTFVVTMTPTGEQKAEFKFTKK